MPLLKEEERFTYQDYITWPDDERWELIDGIAYNMSPAPSIGHQKIAGMFYHILMGNLRGKSCTAFIAPTDVVLSESDVVQPDVFVVCDKEKIKNKNIKGAPDLVIEVLSPSTATKDKREKRMLYETYGVREYIVIDTIEKYVERFHTRKGGRYMAGDIFMPDENMELFSLNNMKISLSEVFGIENVDDHEENQKPSKK